MVTIKEDLFFKKTFIEYKNICENSDSFTEINNQLGIPNKGYNNAIHKENIKKYKLLVKHNTRKSVIYSYADYEFEKLVAISNNYADLLIKLGMATGGNSRKVLRDRIESLNISTEHFHIPRGNSINQYWDTKKPENVFIKHKKTKWF